MISDQTLKEIYKLKNIIRYNTRSHIKNESVAEHSFYVGLIALMLCDELKVNETIKCKVIIKSLLHDMPEMNINAITYDAKEKLNLRPLLAKYENEYFEQNFPKYVELMKDDSEENIVNVIVNLADVLSVKQFVNNEIALGNNDEDIKEIYRNTLIRIDRLKEKLNK